MLHDGVDTDFCTPKEDVKFVIEDKNLTLTKADEVVTYATRGMEEYRGFPQFMEAISILQKKRPNMQVVIAGEDRVCYGPQLVGTTYKKLMLEKLDLDLSRIHFVGSLIFNKYVDLLRISSAHVYATYPFVCSWSLLDAMSCACPIVASKTEPVTEFMTDNKTGLLFDFFNINQEVEKIEYALDNKEEMKEYGNNARQVILKSYQLKELLPQQINYIKSLIK